MKYLSPETTSYVIMTHSPVALSFWGGTEQSDTNYIQPVDLNNKEEDEDW